LPANTCVHSVINNNYKIVPIAHFSCVIVVDEKESTIPTKTLSAVLDSLDTHIAVIDSQGAIQYVNEAWKMFARNNGIDDEINWLSCNYVSACVNAASNGDSSAAEVVDGLYGVIENRLSVFNYEYPCHSETEQRWYVLRVVPLKNYADRFVVSHHNITSNKLTEKQAERLSLEDPLTGLYNRRGLNVFAQEEFSRAIRSQTSISIIIIDVDHFKFFNDSFGHFAGDRCLKNVATIIRTHARRPGDVVARIGGDEFVLMLSQTDRVQALHIANRIKDSVYNLGLSLPDKQRVTISAGITSFIPKKDSNFQDILYKEADAALYVAKKKRNCTYAMDVITDV
jgi:diguanylate cyclase (GGDEF)-like protein